MPDERHALTRRARYGGSAKPASVECMWSYQTGAVQAQRIGESERTAGAE